MNDWEEIKKKILLFGEDDYVFADMFISIVNEYENIHNIEDLKIYAMAMLNELMESNLIKIFLLKKDEKNILINEEYSFKTPEQKKDLIKIIDERWKALQYRLPNPDEIFWVTSDLCIDRNAL
ncbi:hypothetical protein [Chryseobacterium luquanense]|uniref:Uncharacterized protein n=1 Tax=Chryseobacterium luquanense TaxID=2983766 RepID=A0ABT3Y1E6_9FLAO|nr:hypothetical protein [Chryseobacterium luquanense]MCX8531950.1 hypothetical protein [Chryseobacterium luquanense]